MRDDFLYCNSARRLWSMYCSDVRTCYFQLLIAKIPDMDTALSHEQTEDIIGKVKTSHNALSTLLLRDCIETPDGWEIEPHLLQDRTSITFDLILKYFDVAELPQTMASSLTTERMSKIRMQMLLKCCTCSNATVFCRTLHNNDISVKLTSDVIRYRNCVHFDC